MWQITLCTLFLLFATTSRSLAAGPTGPEPDEDELATEVEDPTAILTQLQFQDQYTPRNFQTSAQTDTIQLRPVVPIERFWFLPFQQVIRPTFKVDSIATSSGASTITEFSDMELFDLFVSDWPNPKTTGFGWGIGPTFVFPTGRVPSAGKHAWEAGPAAAVVYKGIPRMVFGFLFQNPISFAYTNSSATPQNELQFQPRISYTIGHGWYVKSSDSTWKVQWRHGGSTTIPLSFGVGKVWDLSGLELNPWITYEWTTYRQNTGITPMYTIRFGLTMLFPDFLL